MIVRQLIKSLTVKIIKMIKRKKIKIKRFIPSGIEAFIRIAANQNNSRL